MRETVRMIWANKNGQQNMGATPAYEEAIQFALNQLRSQLAPEITYHNAWHTERAVLPAAMQLAKASGVSDTDRCLLAVAAAFHDVGFVHTRVDHEAVGVRIVQEVLPRFGFSPAQIECIGGMILATRMPQSPTNELEAILADADLDVLGRDDFFARSEALMQETARFERPLSRREWLESQLTFLQNHQYFTAAARTRRDAGKRRHIAMLKEQLATL